eukprot:c26764_g1_i1.p1 GENE.c26764_g1_i1~~c26764_g1_i1.p1  ORF type:complete len:116 (+),score=17.22 c26764_g1_i1:353-700(+)
MAVKMVAMYLDYPTDESYTPSKIAIRCGTHHNDLQQVATFNTIEPKGWVTMNVMPDESYLRTRMLQIVILQNHQSGRDVHIRMVQVFGPRDSAVRQSDYQSAFSTVDFMSLAAIR